MGDRVWLVPQAEFAAVWNAAGSVAEAVERIKELAGVHVPRWAVMARVTALRKDGLCSSRSGPSWGPDGCGLAGDRPRNDWSECPEVV
jgi:hypothetical protein